MSHTYYFTVTDTGLVKVLHPSQLPPTGGNHYKIEACHDGAEDATELGWLDYFIHHTPNGSLYYENSIRFAVDGTQDIVLVHATLSLDEIKRSGILYPSVGCLGAAIFAVPLTNSQRIHNFTQYIIDREIPMIKTTKSIDDRRVELIGIKIKQNMYQRANKHCYGFNYLYLGPMQYRVYQDFTRHFSQPDDRRQCTRFERAVVRQIRESRDFLNLCCDYELDLVDSDMFFRQLHKALWSLPFLGYVYFETLSEYVQLYQVDAESQRLKAGGELNIRHFKDLVYALAPELTDGFDLEKFRPAIADVVNMLKMMDRERKLFRAYDEYAFLNFMKWRLAQSVRLKVLGKQRLPEDVRFESNQALTGHIVHRLIGEVRYMQPYLWEYDMSRAERIWQDWQVNGITFVENAVMPRGEVGVNPLLPADSYEIYRLETDTQTDGVLFKEKLAVTIAHTIAGGSLMGSSNNSKKVYE